MIKSSLVNRNIVAQRGRTSIRLEPEFWEALSEISKREHRDIRALVCQIEASGCTGGRTSAIRVFILEYFRSAGAATDKRFDHRQIPGSADILEGFETLLDSSNTVNTPRIPPSS